MIPLLIAHVIAAVHASAGPHGFVVWVQLPHIGAGTGRVAGHFVAWFQTAQ